MKKTSTPKAFNIYFDTFEHIEMLTMEQRGELFTALYEYAINERTTEFDNGMVKMAFSFMKAQIARDFEKYREKCEKNRACVLKRYKEKEKSTNVYERSQEEKENSTNVYERNQEEKEEEKEKNKEKDKEEEKEKEKKEENKKEEEKEYKKEKENLKNSSLSDSLSSRIDYDSVMYSYNRICTNLNTADKMTPSRRQAVDNAVNILGDTAFEELFERVQSSDFLSGKNGKWYGCNFDWILKPENLKKILSGAYDNPAPKPEPHEEYKPYHDRSKRNTSYDINELKKIDTLDFMDEPGWEERAFASADEQNTGWDVPF